MSITMGVNRSPVGGQSGTKLTSSKIRERLEKEMEAQAAEAAAAAARRRPRAQHPR